jgi:hypothetical protein
MLVADVTKGGQERKYKITFVKHADMSAVCLLVLTCNFFSCRPPPGRA